MNIVGIIGAMEEEVNILKDTLKLYKQHKRAKMEFYVGKSFGKEIVLVRSGIGKVNAAVCAQVLISEFHVDTIINIGVAGAIYEELEVGDIVISEDVVEHDFDATSFEGYKLGEIPRMKDSIFPGDKELVEIAYCAGENPEITHKTFKGRILSGDIFVACPEKKDFLWKEFRGYCTEMEGAAIGHTCYLNNIPFVIIRAMSDKADGTANISFNEFLNEAVKNSTNIVLNILKQIK